MAIDAEKLVVAISGVAGSKRKPGVLWRAVAAAWSYFEKRDSRRDLGELTDDQLEDIGVTRSEARSEIGKSWYWT
ncbi:DUF1127 domain-containing protein [Rhizobium lusitanum]|uniref:Uncharacterized protein YjiS (DUF1127 family) n=1 Tax=Rhizobium lusitanum TaxID=293958 RepID=A0A7X0IUH0_9HYPH|nr:DUF1127 domain-containing protein [Rhizobium lusitanum]MBB6487428.1 uncharacterized protein YjiS (DUF1127 family) [Rhizobium lusitanum]